MVPERTVRQVKQSASLRVGLKLPVPQLVIKLREPVSECALCQDQ
jgi:hypothetical protein